MTREPVIELEHIRVQFGQRVVLQDISLMIYQGEFIAVLGPNGAGKSVLLELLLGLLKPSAGAARVLHQAPRRGNAAVGYAPQHRALEGDLALRARDVVGFGLDGNRWGIGFPSTKRRVLIEKALDEVNACAYADAPVGRLSGGEQQRLLIAQALLTNPRLLLLDEPLSNLDIRSAHEVVRLVARLGREHGVAVVLVAHDMNPLLEVMDRVLYLAEGRSAIGHV